MKKLISLLLPFMLALTACSGGQQNDGNALVLQSEKNTVAGYEEGSFDVHLTCPAGYSQARAAVNMEAQHWLYLAKLTQGKDTTEAVLTFNYLVNETLKPRNTRIDFFAQGSPHIVSVDFQQYQEMILKVPREEYQVSPLGGEFLVSLASSVDFDLTIETLSGKDWISWIKDTNDGKLHFDIQPIPEKSGDRSAKVRLSQKNTPEGYKSLETTFTIIQKGHGEKTIWAVDMMNSCLFPKWEMQERNPMNNHNGTAEVMIYPRGYNAGFVTIMGADRHFLLRFGTDNRFDEKSNRLSFVWFYMYKPYSKEIDYEFELEKWYHIAVTWDELHICCYINGKQVTDFYVQDTIEVNEPWKENGAIPQYWHYGYSFSEVKSFDGLMTGFRLWERDLVYWELTRPGHIQELNDDDRRGLIGNWLPVKDSGSSIENQVSGELSDAPLFGEVNFSIKSPRKGEPGMHLVPVILPE